MRSDSLFDMSGDKLLHWRFGTDFRQVPRHVHDHLILIPQGAQIWCIASGSKSLILDCVLLYGRRGELSSSANESTLSYLDGRGLNDYTITGGAASAFLTNDHTSGGKSPDQPRPELICVLSEWPNWTIA
jgi:hypothetical protein